MSEEIVASAKKKWKRDQSAWSEVYDKAKEDLHFLSDDEYAQWDSTDAKARTETGRPAITVDQLTQFVHQVANDVRMNTPTINVIPGDKAASIKTAEKLKGLIRGIEYSSNADDAYDTAVLNSIKCSIGFIRVDHDYVDGEGFEQELLIRRVVNPLACLIDADSIECDGRDAKHGTIIDKMLVSDFKRQFPDKEVCCFEQDAQKTWADSDHVCIAEHFVVVEEEKEIGLTESGETKEVDKKSEYKSKRKVKKTKVRRYKLSGKEVLEETTFPGKYIPLVPVYGEEAWIEGKRHVFSLIRKSKGAQRMFNFWKSLETELLMKQPQAPIMAAEGQIEPYAEDWKNPAKAMALRYSQTDSAGNPAPPPQRLAPPTIPTGIVNAARETVDDIKATMGLYNASIGQRSNETSGKAINERKQEGDVATYHFGDNLVRSITQVGRILVCAIPEIYDTARIVRIIGMEDEPESVGINGEKVEGQEEDYDLRKGKYDVRVVTGASFTTRRQEAATFFTEIVTRQPDLMQVMGDLLFKNMDFTGAPAMAERMKKIIDPKLLDEGKDAPDPEKQQLQAQLQEAQAIMQQMQQALAQAEQEKKNDTAKVQIDGQKVQIDAAVKGKELELKDRELDLKERELLAKEAESAGKLELEREKIKADVTKSRIDARSNASPDAVLMDNELHDSGTAPLVMVAEVIGNSIAQGMQQIAMSQAEGNQALIAAISKPKVATMRDNKGNVVRTGTVQ